MYDIIIKNGTIIDGTGRTPTTGTVAIKKNRIADISPQVAGEADTIIDAAGHYVCSGFIDITNHSDTHWTLFDTPSQESMLRQGITTIIGGSCGTSLAPLLRGEIGVEAIQKWVDTSTININWLSMREYLGEIERHKPSVNIGTLVGHSTLRRNILGNAVRPATTDELDRMGYLLETALQEGALGISFGLAFSHGQSASEDELTYLAKIVATHNGLVTIHMRDEGKNLLPAITEVLRIARASGARTHIVHFKALGRDAWHRMTQALRLIDVSREEGLPITVSAFPYTKTGSLLYTLLPPETREGGKEKILKRITDQKQKRVIIENIRALTLHYDAITIASAKETPHIVGSSIEEASVELGLSPEETFLEILALNELAVTIFNETIHPNHISAIYLQPYAYFATDGVGMDIPSRQETKNLPHPRSFGASAQFLSTYVRNKSIIRWETAIAKMSNGPARLLEIPDRGVLQKNAIADITILNPREISAAASYINPFQFPNGIPWVIVNGHVAVKDNELINSRNGTILRRES